MIKKRFCVLLSLLVVCLCFCVFTGCSKKQTGTGRYEITAEYFPENSSLRGTVKITFENTMDSELDALKFQIYPNAYKKQALHSPIGKEYQQIAYYDGESYGEMIISSVHGAKNWEITGEDDNILSVFLERSLYTGDKVVLDIAFTVKLAKVKHDTGITPKTVNLGRFYPILCGTQNGGFVETRYYPYGAPFFFDSADYTVSITTPKEYFVACSGTLLQERMLESKIKRVYQSLQSRDFAMSLSKEFICSKAQVDGTEICYYHYADTQPKSTLSTIVKAFSYYQTVFGEYPYGVFTVAETGHCKRSAEYTGLVVLDDSLSLGERTRAIVKGTALSWWRFIVGSDTLQNAWQSDGLAEYSALLFYEKHGEYGVDKEKSVADYLKEYRSYYDVYGSVLGRTDTRMTRGLGEFAGEHEYDCIVKNKTVIMLDSLRKSIGDKKFLGSLRRYYENNRFQTALVGDFISAFEKSGVSVGGFFDGFLSGKGIL